MVSNRRSCVMKISDINRAAGTNPRADVNDAVVREYASAMRLGDAFPPVTAITDGDEYWLVDGFHRVAALEYNGHDSVVVVYAFGTLDDAMWESCAANKAHGFHRSNADKRRAVERALLNPRGARLSDRQIGRYCSVHHDTVGRIRRELVASGGIVQMSLRDVVRNGKSYTQAIEGVAASNRSRRSPVSLGVSCMADVQPIGGDPDVPNQAEAAQVPSHNVKASPPPSEVQSAGSDRQAFDRAPTTNGAALGADQLGGQAVAGDATKRRDPRPNLRLMALESLAKLVKMLNERTGDVVAVADKLDHTDIPLLVDELRRVSARLLQALDRLEEGSLVSTVSAPLQRDPPRPSAM